MGCNASTAVRSDAEAPAPASPTKAKSDRTSNASSGVSSKSTIASSTGTVASELGKLAEDHEPPARLFLVVGTEGSGKTTLIRHVRFLYDETCAAASGPARASQGSAPTPPPHPLARRYAAECAKFVKSVRQASVRAIQAVLRERLDGASETHRATIDKVMSLGRRDVIDASVRAQPVAARAPLPIPTSRRNAQLAEEVQELWREPAVKDAMAKMSDRQTAEASAHFVQRLTDLAADKCALRCLSRSYRAPPPGG